jgi:heme A synthase
MTNSLRAIYRFWAILIFVAVLVQVALAGYGAFDAAKKVGDGPNDTTPTLTNKQWDHGFGPHDALGYIIFLASVLLLLFALGARLGRRRVLLALCAPLLVFVQIVLAIAGGSIPAVGALHPLNALVIVGFTAYLAREAYRKTWLVTTA